MAITVEKALLGTSATQFVARHVLDRLPHAFPDWPTYFAWKTILAERLSLDAASICLVGSAAVGTSLNPKKGFKAFDAGSDIDVAVISAFHFLEAWRWLQRNGHLRARMNQVQRRSYDAHRQNYVYWGTIATDRLLGFLPFARTWVNARTHMATIAPTLGRDVNFRLYFDFESLRSYQESGARDLRRSLIQQTTEVSNEPLP